MVGVEFRVTGLNDVIKTLEKLDQKDLIESVIEDTGNYAYKEARKLSPVDTGRLKDSIYMYPYGNKFSLGASAPYASYNEYGSITTPAGSVSEPVPAKKQGFRPFLRPAMYKAMRQFDYIFGKKFSERLK